VRNELTRLRDRVETLGNRLQPRIAGAADDAAAFGDQAQRRVKHEAARVSHAVKEQPLVALGLAVVTGFILASLVKR